VRAAAKGGFINGQVFQGIVNRGDEISGHSTAFHANAPHLRCLNVLWDKPACSVDFFYQMKDHAIQPFIHTWKPNIL
jgi:hypothetical protein